MDDPMKKAQAAARPVLPKRFYDEVRIERQETGHAVLLDGRPVRTPQRNLLVLPTRPLAEALADEWRAQKEVVDPATMPITRLSNSALDGVRNAMEAVRADIVRYAGSDLVCYRADGPEGLIAMQTEHWDPLVRWARQELGLELVLTEGVMHVAQPDPTLDRVQAEIEDYDPVALAALHVMASLTASAVIALAVAHGRLSAEGAWIAAHVDEDWQISQWGADAEAMHRRQLRWCDMEAAAKAMKLLRA